MHAIAAGGTNQSLQIARAPAPATHAAVSSQLCVYAAMILY